MSKSILCECGCGEITKPGNRFIHGHHRGNKGKHHSKEAKLKMRTAHLGKKATSETRAKMSEKMSGENNPMYGMSGEKSPSYGKHRSEETKKKISDSQKGKIISQETRDKIGEGNRGKTISQETRDKISIASKNKTVSEESRSKISNTLKGHKFTDETRNKISDTLTGRFIGVKHPFYGKHHSVETRMKLSATLQGIPYDEWEGYVKDNPYCPKFNEACKESNREKYGRRCFVCGLPENDNITSTGMKWKLSVHHVDMDKQQGCDGNRWRLVPVCMHCHGILHDDIWMYRVIYLLGHIWRRYNETGDEN